VEFEVCAGGTREAARETVLGRLNDFNLRMDMAALGISMGIEVRVLKFGSDSLRL
jgi:hypothetical protein